MTVEYQYVVYSSPTPPPPPTYKLAHIRPVNPKCLSNLSGTLWPGRALEPTIGPFFKTATFPGDLHPTKTALLAWLRILPGNDLIRPVKKQ